ncbi:MAG TPA: response regulator, partial [Terriglobales bacterium]|nr:response regulator [Terriglobales bacterium]
MPGKHVLCIDDDPEALGVRRLLLEDSGYSIATAKSGSDALEMLARGTPVDLVLLDYLMPGMNGDELAAKLRQQYPQLPLVVVSAVGQLPPSLLENTNAQVQKGQDPEELLCTISSALGEPEESGTGEIARAAQQRAERIHEVRIARLLAERVTHCRDRLGIATAQLADD